MATVSDVWQLFVNAEPPAPLSKLTLREVVVEPSSGQSSCLLLVLPDKAVSTEELDRALAAGTIVVISEEPLTSTYPLHWVDPARATGLPEAMPPIGIVVPDAKSALLRLAALWRAETRAKIVAIVGAEVLRTSQRLIQSVLNQRYQTGAPDTLLCNPVQTALALLSLRPYSERLLIRLNLSDPDNLRFVQEVVRPEVIVLTNSPVGIDNNSTLPESTLVNGLSSNELAIINVDDPHFRELRDTIQGAVFCYGLEPSCDLWGSHIESQGREGLRLRLHYGSETVHVRIPLLGRYSVHAALAAAAVGLASSESWEEIVAGLRALSAQLHMILTPGIGGTVLLEDVYDATPSSTLSVLNLLEGFPGRKVAVIGELVEFAPYEIEGHQKVGRRALDVASELITVGELGKVVAQEALDSGMPRERVHAVNTNEEAVQALKAIIQAGDLILVTGAGRMRMKEIVDQVADRLTWLCEI